MGRDQKYDIIKAIAIWLVVLGHCISAFCEYSQESKFHLAILMFHMPLFIFVSGHFFYPSVTKCNFKFFFIRRFRRLYVPSLFWGITNLLILGGKDIVLGNNVDLSYCFSLLFRGAWFLTVLFLISIIGGLIECAPIKRKLVLWIVSFLIIYFLPSWWMVNELKFLMPYFIIAIVLKQRNVEFNSWVVALVSLLIFCICLSVYDWQYTMYAMMDNCLEIDYHIKAFVRFVAGMSGIVLILFLVSRLHFPRIIIYYMSIIGATTLPIYVLQNKIIQLLSMLLDLNIWIICIILPPSVIILCMYIYKILSRNRLLSQLMYGEY